MNLPRPAVVALAAGPVVLYVAVVVAGGAPRFVSAGECVRPATAGETRELEIVYGRFDRHPEAEALAARARAVGYRDTVAEPDGCGRWKVVNGAVDSYAGGADAVEEGARAGLEGRLEIAPG